MKKLLTALILFLVPLGGLGFAMVAHAQDPGALTASQLSAPAIDEGPVVQIQGTSGNGCPANAQPSGSECYSCPSGDTLSGTTCNPSAAGTSPPAATTPAPTNSAGFVPLAPIPGLTSAQSNVTAATLSTFLNNLYKYLIGIAAVLAVIQIIRGGILIMGESVSGKGKGREIVQQALLGLVLVLAPVLVFTIINPAILNLSLSLPSITQQAVSQSSSSSNGSGSSAPVSSGVQGCVAEQGATTQVTTFTCTDTTDDAANLKAQSYLSQSCVSGEAVITENAVCSSSGAATMVNGVQQAGACTGWSTSGYCSPIQSVEVAYTCALSNPLDGASPLVCSPKAYFGSNSAWASACSVGSTWALFATGGQQISGTNLYATSIGGNVADTCPSQYANYKCAKFQAYCGLVGS